MDINSHSLNRDGVRKVQDIFGEFLSDLGLKVELRAGGQFGDHLIAGNDFSQDGILLVGHADTAHVEDTPPRRTFRDGDRIVGPGGYDMKAGVMTFLLALQALKETSVLSDLPLRILIIGDEEVGMQESFDLHAEAAANCSRGLVFESGRPDNMLVLTRKGIAIGAASARGQKAHSGNEFWEGANAILRLSETAVKLAQLSSRERNVTVNIGTFSGGTSPTIVPDEAKMRFDVRFASQREFEEVWKEVEAIARQSERPGTHVDISKVLMLPPMELIPGMDELASSYISIFKELGQESSINGQIIGGASSASILTASGLPTIDALGPFGEGAHTDSEWFSAESFRIKCKTFALWLQRFGTPN